MTRAAADRRSSQAVQRDLAAIVAAGAVLPDDAPGHLVDQTEGRGVTGWAHAVALPATADEVERVVAWCYAREIPIVPRGGGTGFAGGAVPVAGGVVIGLERLTRVRSFDPALWRICVEAGMRTADLRRIARESGLAFPPDPGAAEQSQIGGNVATNAGGPHAFKYGVTGAWVTGIEAVLAPGELVTVGGAFRRDVAGYDLRSLLVGSEGTLGVITAVWLRLLPAPEAALPVAAFYPSPEVGCPAALRVLADGLPVAALEYMDTGALAAAGGSYPNGLPAGARFMVIAEADGGRAEAERLRDQVAAALAPGAIRVDAPGDRSEAELLWRWRDGVSIAVTARRGAKVSEDIVVPLDRLAEAVAETVEIGRRHDLDACSWGHAGDGNLHSTFMVDPGSPVELERASAAAQELFALAVRLGGSVSGEHGVGLVKRGQLARQWHPRAVELHAAVKRAFDPKGLLNPQKKVAGPGPQGGDPA